MKKLNCKTILVLLMTISSICLGNIQINTYIKKLEPTNITKVEPSPNLGPANLAAWIIIGGDKNDHKNINLIKNGCNIVYEILKDRGFDPNDICYLGPIEPPTPPNQKYFSILSNIQWAIETWAPTRGVDATHGLGIYLLDHGGGGYMCIPGTDLTDTDLNTYLDNLEATTGCNRIIVIYDACYSGSFINPLSKDNRIIVTSTDNEHGAHTNSVTKGVAYWTIFSEKFWSSIKECKTIGECFEDARNHVYWFFNDQFPWIDDNHDEIGHIADIMSGLPTGGDGSDALNVWIGTGLNCPETTVNFFPNRMYMKLGISIKPIWAVVDTDTLIEKVYATIIPPNWTPSEMISDDEGSNLIEDTGFLLIELHDDDGDGNYTGNLYDRHFWNAMGDYKANFYARSQDRTVADIQSTCITLNDDGKPPTDTTPPIISILNPAPNASVSEVINITAEGDDDQALDKIQLFIDGVLLKEEVMPPYLPYPEAVCNLNTINYINGLHNITAIAIDKANNVKQTSIAINIQNGLQIPGFQITTLFIGSLLGVIFIAYYIWKKETKRVR